MRRQRRRELQKSSHALTPVDDGEPDDTDLQSLRDADYTDRQKQQTKEPATSSSTQPASTPSWTLQSQNEPSQSGEDAQPPRRSKPKRHRSDENTEAQADQAATEIVELVEKETTNLLTHWRATQHSPATLQLPDTDVSDIPEHILAESRELSKEVTPPRVTSFSGTLGNDKMATAARRR